MSRDIQIAGCVILYNPDDCVTDNIRTYINYVDKLFVIDNQNGRKVFEELKKCHNNIELISYAENMGIAKPLNDVLKISKGQYTHLLTMDQDSFFDTNVMSMYIELAKNIDWRNMLCIAPQYRTNENTVSRQETVGVYEEASWKEVFGVITSGTILDINKALSIGGFDEKLFIDQVDFDFCYRGWMSGLKTLISNGAIWFNHCVGAPLTVKLLWVTCHPWNHNYIRTYYIIRNRIYVMHKDWCVVKKFCLHYIGYIIRDCFYKAFFENDRYRKMRAIFDGVRDAITGNMGKKEFHY